jgi:hypothetical protein
MARNRPSPVETSRMRYVVRARLKPGRESDLLRAIEEQTLGRGSIAEGEYLRNMGDARLCSDQTVRWVEICYCPTPLQEERPYWEQYFDLTRVQDAHDRRKCRDENGSEAWGCDHCDCTARLEEKLRATGETFLQCLRGEAGFSSAQCRENIGAKAALKPATPPTASASLQFAEK